MSLIIFALLFMILKFNKQQEKSDAVLNRTDVKISQKDFKIQKRVAKEIENFLNYNGEIQDDI